MRYIVDLCGANVIRAKDSAFILWLTFRQLLPRTSVRETTLKDVDFPLRPSQSYKLKPISRLMRLIYRNGSKIEPNIIFLSIIHLHSLASGRYNGPFSQRDRMSIEDTIKSVVEAGYEVKKKPMVGE